MSATQYDPDQFLVSTVRSLQDYVAAKLDSTYLLMMESFSPAQLEPGLKTPFPKTIVTFDMSDHDSPPIGFGVPGREEYIDPVDTDPLSVDPPYVVLHEVQDHRFSFSVEVWASAEAGGATSRMIAVQLLASLFNGPGARKRLAVATNGIEVLQFHGGTSITDKINDLPVWRMMDMTLALRVFSRYTDEDGAVAIQSFTPVSALTIDPNDSSL